MSHHLVGMAEIAEIIGVSRQRVSQLIETYEDFPAPEAELAGGRVWSRTAIETWIANHPEREPGRPDAGDFDQEGRRRRFLTGEGLFSRFTDFARRSIVLAQQEARNLNHNYIGTEHLLLGLVALEEGVAYQAIDSLALRLSTLRDKVVEMVGRGTTKPEGHIPFTPRAKTVLEGSLAEALKLGHNYIGTEHVLLSLVGETDCVAWKALAAHKLEPDDVRNAVMTSMVRHVPAPASDPITEASKKGYMQCSFCSKAQEEVEKLIAGPGVFICNECIDLCNEIITEEEKPAVAAVDDRLAQIEKRLSELERKD